MLPRCWIQALLSLLPPGSRLQENQNLKHQKMKQAAVAQTLLKTVNVLKMLGGQSSTLEVKRGSLVVRMVFLPFEESSYATFARAELTSDVTERELELEAQLVEARSIIQEQLYMLAALLGIQLNSSGILLGLLPLHQFILVFVLWPSWVFLRSLQLSVGIIIHAHIVHPAVSSILVKPWFSVLVIALAVERLCGLALRVAMERDWVVLLAGTNRPIALAQANAILSRIDLVCEVTRASLFGIFLSNLGW